MSRVEILESTNLVGLEKRINDRLEERGVVDIKYSISTFRGDTLYSAMIIYE